jgi:hypothetical protein
MRERGPAEAQPDRASPCPSTSSTRPSASPPSSRPSFAEPTGEKPFTYAYKPTEGQPTSRGAVTARKVRIENARPFAGRLSLDAEGLAVARWKSAVRDFWDEAQTLALGHPKAAELVKEVTGASRDIMGEAADALLNRRAASSTSGARSPMPPATGRWRSPTAAR